MAYDTLTLAGSTVFVSTIFMILLHGLEWFHIGTLLHSQLPNALAYTVSSKLQVLKGELGIETVCYFLLLVAFAVFFPSNLVLLTVMALLGLVHFQALVGGMRANWLQKLTAGRVAGLLVFDVLEIVFLLILAFGFYPFFQALIRA